MIRVGMSGWTFAPWRGRFYPKGLVQKKELEYASRKVSSIEINGTFYSLQKPASFQHWYSQVPEDFVFSVKAPQYITHIRRLREIEEPLANFFASGLLSLGKKLGPILWQFPPNVMLKDDRFEKFIKLLPQTGTAAAKLARGHGEKVEGRAFLTAKGIQTVRHAFEFRHPSFFNTDFLQLLRAHGIAIVFAHGGDEALYCEEPTADFIYARMHGEGKEFARGYPKKVLVEWKAKLKAWTKKRDAYVYFNTDAKVYSPSDALEMLSLLEA